jgi:hypothetical protein
MEIYKIIPNYPNYSISNLGNLKNNKTDKILKTWIAGVGYEYCRIINDLGHFKTTVHKLVANTFLIKPNLLFEIDHIDRNKLNNKLENLRFVSKSDNLLNRKCILKKNKNKQDEHYNIYKIKQIRKDVLYEYFNVVIKQKKYGIFKNINDAIKKRDEIISNLNI